MYNKRQQLEKMLKGAFLSLAVLFSVGAGGALAIQSLEAEPAAEVAASSVADVPELERAYKVHCSRRSEIARRLSLLWFEETELKAEYEDTGRSGSLPDFVELAAELRQVRLNIDAARADLSRENKIILAIGDRIPD